MKGGEYRGRTRGEVMTLTVERPLPPKGRKGVASWDGLRVRNTKRRAMTVIGGNLGHHTRIPITRTMPGNGIVRIARISRCPAPSMNRR